MTGIGCSLLPHGIGQRISQNDMAKTPQTPRKRSIALWVNLKNGLKPNGWTGKPKPITQLKRRSRSYTKRMRIYRKQVIQFLRRHPQCAVFAGQKATQCHHRFGRIARLLLWEPGWVAVSAEGHDKINQEKVWARSVGLLGPCGSWNNYEAARKLMENV